MTWRGNLSVVFFLTHLHKYIFLIYHSHSLKLLNTFCHSKTAAEAVGFGHEDNFVVLAKYLQHT